MGTVTHVMLDSMATDVSRSVAVDVMVMENAESLMVYAHVKVASGNRAHVMSVTMGGTAQTVGHYAAVDVCKEIVARKMALVPAEPTGLGINVTYVLTDDMG